LSAKPVDFGIDQPGAVWAVAMDLATDAGIATVVGMSDGRASLYTKSAYGIEGDGAHERVRDAAIRLCAVATRHVYATDPATRFPYPEPGQVNFLFLTPTGPRFATADESDLRSGAHALFELFFAAHALVSELRQIAEA
jgi:hypothetical protein